MDIIHLLPKKELASSVSGATPVAGTSRMLSDVPLAQTLMLSCFCSTANRDGNKKGSQAAAAQRTSEGKDKCLHVQDAKDLFEHRCIVPSTHPSELTTTLHGR